MHVVASNPTTQVNISGMKVPEPMGAIGRPFGANEKQGNLHPQGEGIATTWISKMMTN